MLPLIVGITLILVAIGASWFLIYDVKKNPVEGALESENATLDELMVEEVTTDDDAAAEEALAASDEGFPLIGNVQPEATPKQEAAAAKTLYYQDL